MSGNVQHIMERRAEMLADAINHRVDLLAEFLTMDDRPVFTKKLRQAEALSFWQRHRYDEFGAQILASWTPEQILALDAALGRAASEGRI
jgi:hypothetical protein